MRMQYVIMDLEWNSAFSKKLNGYLNEIIEIGAVKLNDRLRDTGEFRMFVRAQLTKKLHTRIKNLTHIQNEDLTNGLPFTKAMSEFKKWIGSEETVILTWGETDLRVLIENFKYFNGIPFIPFLKQYGDLQVYVQEYLHWPREQQLGLSAAAQLLAVDTQGLDLHRALTDSILSAGCMRNVFHKLDFSSFIRICDQTFYDRLSFKAYYISDINSPLVDKTHLHCKCENCNTNMERISHWEYKSQAFRAIFYCRFCNKKYRYSVRYKRNYDSVTVRSRLLLLPAEEKGKDGKIPVK